MIRLAQIARAVPQRHRPRRARRAVAAGSAPSSSGSTSCGCRVAASRRERAPSARRWRRGRSQTRVLVGPTDQLRGQPVRTASSRWQPCPRPHRAASVRSAISPARALPSDLRRRAGSSPAMSTRSRTRWRRCSGDSHRGAIDVRNANRPGAGDARRAARAACRRHRCSSCSSAAPRICLAGSAAARRRRRTRPRGAGRRARAAPRARSPANRAAATRQSAHTAQSPGRRVPRSRPSGRPPSRPRPARPSPGRGDRRPRPRATVRAGHGRPAAHASTCAVRRCA
jgi:hypothetical protein